MHTNSSGEGAGVSTEHGHHARLVEEIVVVDERTGEVEGFVLFAKQVCKYNGEDRKMAWQLFCEHFSGMMRYISHEPDMRYLSYEQQILLEGHISR